MIKSPYPFGSHYLFCIFCKFFNQDQTLAYHSKTIENSIVKLYIFWKLNKRFNKIWKKKIKKCSSGDLRVLNILKMVAKVVKNTKLLTLSSIIWIKFKHRSGKWTILLRHIFWEQKAKKKKNYFIFWTSYVTRKCFRT